MACRIPADCLDLNGDGDQRDYFLLALDMTEPNVPPVVIDEIDAQSFAGYCDGAGENAANVRDGAFGKLSRKPLHAAYRQRKIATQLGATDVIDPSVADPVEQVKALTGGRGVDYAFEVIGLPETIVTTYNLARRGGEVIIVGMARFDAQFTLPAFGIFYEQKTVKGSKYGSAQVRRDFPRFVELIETDRLDISSMVSKTIKLEDVNDAFRAMEAGEVIRSVIA